MLIVLFIFEIIIMGLTILTTHMIEHKFKMIKISLAVYGNKRTYKTKANVDFIESILTMYRKIILDTNEEPDLESAIKRKLHQESIGKFGYISVKNIAIKARRLMWGILGLELAIAWMNQEIYSRQAIFLMAGSLLVTIAMAFYGMIKGIDEKSEALIDEIIHYVRNVYPLEKKRGMSIVTPKNSTAISLEEHKIKKEEMKISEKQIVRDQAYELRNYEMEKVSIHKESNVKKDKVVSCQMNQQNDRKDQEGDAEALRIKEEMGEVIKNTNNQGVQVQGLEEHPTEKEAMELSASDIAQLLTHL